MCFTVQHFYAQVEKIGLAYFMLLCFIADIVKKCFD